MAKGAEHSAPLKVKYHRLQHAVVRLWYGTGSWLKFTILLWIKTLEIHNTFLLRNADEVGVIRTKFDLFEFVARNFGMSFAIKSF